MTTDARYMQPSRDKTVPRGIRNCNPLNVDRTRDPWLGMTRDQSQDPRFCVFDSPQYGFRCAAKLLLNYQVEKRDGDRITQRALSTIGDIIGKWAPTSENDTNAYAAAVSKEVGVGVDEQIGKLREQPALLLSILRAMVKHENGECPYDDDVIVEGMKLAGVTIHTPPKEAPAFANGFDGTVQS